MLSARPVALSMPAAALRRAADGRWARWRSAIAVFLVWALWLAPSLGFMHRMVHAPTAGIGAAVAHAHHAAWVDALFTGHAESDCRLYDQHCQGGSPAATPQLALPLSPGDGPGLAPHAAPTPRAPAHFEARAPPLRA